MNIFSVIYFEDLLWYRPITKYLIFTIYILILHIFLRPYNNAKDIFNVIYIKISKY